MNDSVNKWLDVDSDVKLLVEVDTSLESAMSILMRVTANQEKTDATIGMLEAKTKWTTLHKAALLNSMVFFVKHERESFKDWEAKREEKNAEE